MRDWLLSPDQIVFAHIEGNREVSGYGTGAAEHRAAEDKAICKAQLAHCEPLIRADERVRLAKIPDRDCPRCGGEGKVKGKEITDPIKPTTQRVWESVGCPDCDGTGQIAYLDYLIVKLFALFHDEEFDTACVVNEDTAEPCSQWNASAHYCMRKSAASCPKVVAVLGLMPFEDAVRQERERITGLIHGREACEDGTNVPWPSESQVGISSRQRRMLLGALFPEVVSLKETLSEGGSTNHRC